MSLRLQLLQVARLSPRLLGDSTDLVRDFFRRQFTPEGGAIGVRARLHGDDLLISVSDTGPGISPENLPRIFDRFWQAEETRTMGAGLGLTIVKGIAEAHGGRVWAESQPGVGSSFHFAVPLDGVTRSVDTLQRAS